MRISDWSSDVCSSDLTGSLAVIASHSRTGRRSLLGRGELGQCGIDRRGGSGRGCLWYRGLLLQQGQDHVGAGRNGGFDGGLVLVGSFVVDRKSTRLNSSH